MHLPILLFDVNGVITTAVPEADLNSYDAAIERVFGLKVSVRKIEYSGMTAKGILTALLKGSVGEEEIEGKMSVMLEERFDYYKKNITEEEIRSLPGVKELLYKLNRRGYILGTLTGVQKSIAEYQLKTISLLDYFRVRSYGDRYVKRTDLFHEAICQAKNIIGENVDKSRVYYFDDSKKGLQAGKEVGVKTVAVATGNQSLEELMQAGPNFALSNLKNKNAVLDIIR